jgi:hypothetical protein
MCVYTCVCVCPCMYSLFCVLRFCVCVWCMCVGVCACVCVCPCMYSLFCVLRFCVCVVCVCVCTLSQLSYTELYDLDGCCAFVSDFIAYEPLEDPLHPPEYLPSPLSVLNWQVCTELDHIGTHTHTHMCTRTHTHMRTHVHTHMYSHPHAHRDTDQQTDICNVQQHVCGHGCSDVVCVCVACVLHPHRPVTRSTCQLYCVRCSSVWATTRT